MAGIKQIEASKLAPLSERLDALDKQEAEEAEATTHQNPALSASELAKLGDMSKDELIALINRVSGAIWGIAMMSKDERIEAAKLKLWNAGLTQPDIFKALPALREALDRETGKPAQSIAMKVETDAISKLSDERLLRLERSLAQMTGEDAIIIAPLPGKLED